MSAPIVQVHAISKHYGSFRAVHDLSFEVEGGEIFALLGPNGAGKSTTIRMILDIIKPDSGQIGLFGAALTEAAKNRIGYLPEERGLYKSVTVIDMMTYLGRLKGLAANAAKKRALALLETLELGAYAKKKVSELSKGMQQKIQFAVTIQHDPELIIIDEPFSGLDPVNRLVIKQLLQEFQARGSAVIMSTHQMNQIEEMADRMLMIARGERKLYGEVSAIRKQFAQHAIIVQGQGNWAALPGVLSVEPHSNGREGMLLNLKPDFTADMLLATMAQAPDYHVEKFEMAIPSLDDIFIQVAGQPATLAAEEGKPA